MSESEKQMPEGDAAVQYVNDQLAASKASLNRVRTFGIIIVLFVLMYMTWITRKLNAALEPQNAAQTTKDLLVLQMNQHAQGISDNLAQRVPDLMQELPEYAMNQIPRLRENLEDRILAQVSNYSRITASELETYLDQFLTEHKDEINRFLNSSQDIDDLRASIGSDFGEMLKQYLDTKVANENFTLMEQLDLTVNQLNEIADRVRHLAENENLTEEEQRTRRAIAVLLQRADFELYDATKNPPPEFEEQID